MDVINKLRNKNTQNPKKIHCRKIFEWKKFSIAIQAKAVQSAVSTILG